LQEEMNYMNKFRGFIVLLAISSMIVSACGKKDEDAGLSPHDTGEIPLQQQPVMTGPAEVLVSEAVKSSWKAITIEVIDNKSGKKQAVTINIGEEKAVEGTGLKVKAISFLPAFQMDGPVVTSTSNEVENPAAQIEIYEGDKAPWTGWLFVLYPSTHAFTHPQYSISLLEGVAADKG